MATKILRPLNKDMDEKDWNIKPYSYNSIACKYPLFIIGKKTAIEKETIISVEISDDFLLPKVRIGLDEPLPDSKELYFYVVKKFQGFLMRHSFAALQDAGKTLKRYNEMHQTHYSLDLIWDVSRQHQKQPSLISQ